MLQPPAVTETVVHNKDIVLIGVFAKNSGFLLYNFSHINLKLFLVVIAAAYHAHLVFNTGGVKAKNVLIAYFNRRIEQDVKIGGAAGKRIIIYHLQAG